MMAPIFVAENIPTRKVGAGIAIGGPLAVILVWGIKTFGHVDVPAEVATAFGSVLTFGVSYFFPDGG